MQFREAREGDYRIFVGACEAPKGDGYTAALVVDRIGGERRGRLAFRDETLACGYRWPTPDEAMHYALNRAREMIRSRSPVLAC